MGLRPLILMLSTTLTTIPAFAQDFPRVSPDSVGLSSAGLAQVTQNLQKHVDEGHIAGAVAAVLRDGKLVYLESVGKRDLVTDSPMQDDALFRIYSMTRPVTSLAAMILWEEGKFQLDDPISKYLPQFAQQRVFIDGSAPDMEQTRERRGDIKVADLMRHTSGLGSRSSRVYVEQGVRLRTISLEQLTDNAARVPLFEDPGTNFRYGHWVWRARCSGSTQAAAHAWPQSIGPVQMAVFKNSRWKRSTLLSRFP